MPAGKGTYGSKRGRPPADKKKATKGKKKSGISDEIVDRIIYQLN